jgi:hypothetical protein
LTHLHELVVKATNASGGYGMLVGPHATKDQHQDFADRIRANPRGYIAQPTLCLSRVPTLINDSFEGCHVDLRPYILYGKDIYVNPGGSNPGSSEERFSCRQLFPGRWEQRYLGCEVGESQCPDSGPEIILMEISLAADPMQLVSGLLGPVYYAATPALAHSSFRSTSTPSPCIQSLPC